MRVHAHTCARVLACKRLCVHACVGARLRANEGVGTGMCVYLRPCLCLRACVCVCACPCAGACVRVSLRAFVSGCESVCVCVFVCVCVSKLSAACLNLSVWLVQWWVRHGCV